MEQSIFIRSTGVTVLDVLKALSRGSSPAQVLEQYKQLNLTDVLASMQLATNVIEQYVTSEGSVKIEGSIKLIAKNSRLINVSKMREAHPRAYEPWRAKETESLVEMFKQGEPFSIIADTLERGEGAVKARLEKLGLIKPKTARQSEPGK